MNVIQIFMIFSFQKKCTKPIEDGCADDEFTCDNGQCIRNHYKCDGRRDCADGSDESLKTCYQGEF